MKFYHMLFMSVLLLYILISTETAVVSDVTSSRNLGVNVIESYQESTKNGSENEKYEEEKSSDIDYEIERLQTDLGQRNRSRTDYFQRQNGNGDKKDEGLIGPNICEICICFTDGNESLSIDCSDKKLDRVPPNIPINTTSLDLSNNNISNIGKHDISYLHQLVNLTMRNISLRSIDQMALYNLTKLVSLEISRNPKFPVTNWTIHEEFFKDLKSLKKLEMYGNTQYLTNGTYPDEALSRLTSLEQLRIDGMNKKIFGPGFRKLANLKTVILSGSHLRQDLVVRYCSTDVVEGMLDNLKNLTNLSIIACFVRHVHKNAFLKTKELEILNLSKNKKLELAGVKASFQSLQNTKIRVLKLNRIYDRLYNNCGVVITADDIKGLESLKSLKELHLEYNAINKVNYDVPKKFPDNLEVLNVRNNEFELGVYMLFIQNISNLKRLDLSYQFFPNLMWENNPPLLSETSFQNTKPMLDDNLGLLNVNDNNPTGLTSSHTKLKSNEENQNMKDGQKLYDNLKNSWVPSSNSDQFPRITDGFLKMFENYLVQELQNKKGIESDWAADKPVCKELPNNILQIVTPSLPPKLEYLDLSVSKLAHPIFAFNISANNNLTMVNMSQCMLYCWDGPVNGIEKLEYLDLGRNFCTDVRISFFDSFPNLKTLLVSMNLLNLVISKDSEGRLFKSLTKLEKLDLSYNRLEAIPKALLRSQTNLIMLNISKNLLSTLELDVSHMIQLQKLDLSNNSISTLSKSMMNDLKDAAVRTYKTGKQLEIDMSDNNIHCFCSNLNFLRWMRDSNCTAMKITVTHCMFDNESRASEAIATKSQLTETIRYLEKHCASYFALAASLTALLFFIMNCILGVIIYRYRWKIRYWYYVTKRDIRSRRSGYQSLGNMSDVGNRDQIHGQYKYHAYIAYVDSDRDFVLGTLRQFLVNTEELTLCISDVDFVPGQNMYRMISNAIHSSKVTIFIVSSETFFDTDWEIAMRMAQQESLSRGNTMFFAIFLDEIPIERICTRKWIDIGNMYRHRQYITYPSQAPREQLQLFWNECFTRIQRQD